MILNSLMMNLEQGMSNDESLISFDILLFPVHNSIFSYPLDRFIPNHSSSNLEMILL